MGKLRYIEDQKRMKRSFIRSQGRHSRGAWFDEDKGRFIRYTPSKRSFTKDGHRRVRAVLRNEMQRGIYSSYNNSQYRKLYRKWWEIW